MDRLFTTEVAIESGCIYLPLVFDQEIERAALDETPKRFKSLMSLRKPERRDSQVLDYEGDKFIRSISLESFVESYRETNPEDYARLRQEYLSRYTTNESFREVGISSMLETIVFQVMPHFIKKGKGLDRRELSEPEILDLIHAKTDIHPGYMQEAERFLRTDELQETIARIENNQAEIPQAPSGRTTGDELRSWVYLALEPRILKEELETLKDTLEQKNEFAEKNMQYIATMLYLKSQTDFSLDGFTIHKLEDNRYQVGVYTPDYALKHWDGSVYLFPGCTVMVDTGSLSNPFVKERYRHPFLDETGSRQRICIRDNNLSSRFSAANMINALETGLNTMHYGYINRRDFNGYHRLSHDMFDGLEVRRDNPRIQSGEVEIKNGFVRW